ncbi:MAG: hypothetical protein ACLQVF_15785, partial [Isosphaeraceae bacterium]
MPFGQRNSHASAAGAGAVSTEAAASPFVSPPAPTPTDVPDRPQPAAPPPSPPSGSNPPAPQSRRMDAVKPVDPAQEQYENLKRLIHMRLVDRLDMNRVSEVDPRTLRNEIRGVVE